jgi:hypothetical protein
MSFLNRLSKSVGKAAEQAKFEADKLVKVNKLQGEVGELGGQVTSVTADIGSKVIELAEAGALQLPEVEEMIAQVKVLSEQLAGKESELAAARSGKYEEAAQAVAEAVEEAPPLSLDDVPETVACAECGAQLTAGTKFCAECGHKMEAEAL